MLAFRNYIDSDIPTICGFPRSERELFHMFPSAVWPLTPAQLFQSIHERHCSTVVEFDGLVAGYANFIQFRSNNVCTVGNVIVNPLLRRQGVGTFLLQTMIARGIYEYGAPRIRLACDSNNRAGLALYARLGFKRIDTKFRMGLHSRLSLAYVLEFSSAIKKYSKALPAHQLMGMACSA